MKVTRIKAKAFLGLDFFDISIERPVLLISGPNAAGKTSVAHALRFVLTDDLCRVEHKKDVRALVRGAKVGSAAISILDEQAPAQPASIVYERSAATGHFTSPHPPPETSEALKYVLNPEAFVRLDKTKRLSFLHKLMGISMSQINIMAELEARGHSRAILSQIADHLVLGFTAACAEAQGLAREAKGRWREITDDTYGEIKAETWVANAEEIDNGTIDEHRSALAAIDTRIASIQKANAIALERKTSRQTLVDRMRRTQDIANELPERIKIEQTYRNAAEEESHRLSLLLDELKDHEKNGTFAASVPQGSFFHCPECGAHLVYSMGKCSIGDPTPVDTGEMERHAAKAADLRRDVARAEKKQEMAQKSLNNALRAVAGARAAVEALADLQPGNKEEEQDADTVMEELTSAFREQEEARQALSRFEAGMRLYKESEAKTAHATTLHQDIKALTALASDLAPDGLPAELLAKALNPLNARLRDSSTMTGWPAVTVLTMGMEIAGRPWDLASSSEQWCAQAMLVEAISHLSRLRIFVLDGLDILEPAARAQAITWLAEIAQEHDTIICMATLKAPPKSMPDAVQSVWIGGAGVAPETEIAKMPETISLDAGRS